MDPLDGLLDLEEQYHAEGYALGLADGRDAGRAEGRQFGMERGFEKFAELGRLHGWTTMIAADLDRSADGSIAPSERLLKQVGKLRELTDIENVSTENSEEGVADFDDRLRDAKSKALILMKLLGRDHTQKSKTAKPGSSSELEDFNGIGKKLTSISKG